MVNAISARNKINNKIFDKLGSTAVRQPYVSKVVDKWGDATITRGTSETIVIVPYSYVNSRREYLPFGTLSEGEVVVALRYDQTIVSNDLVVWDDKTFLVENIEGFPLQNINLVNIVLLKEVVN